MSKFLSIMDNLDYKLQKFEKQLASQFEDFENKQQSMLTMEQEFEKNLKQENENFLKKIQEKRERIQAENRIEETILKKTSELKRKSSIKPQQQLTNSLEYRPIVMDQRQNSSKSSKRKIKAEEPIENISEIQPKIPAKMILKLVKGDFCKDIDSTGKMDPYCKIIFNGKTLKSKVCADQGKTPFWNESFEIFEDFKKEIMISFKVMDKNVETNDKLIGDGVLKLEAKGLKNQNICMDLTKSKTETGKLYIELEFF